MDAFFSGLDSRLRVPVKAADSIMVGLVNAAMEDAYRKSLWKDGDLDRLFHKLRFAELAVMQLDWCLRFVRAEIEAGAGDGDGAGDDGHEQLLDDLIETRERIQASLDEAERSVAEADRDYTRRKRAVEPVPSRGREAAPLPSSSAAGHRDGADEEEDGDGGGGRAFGEMRGSVSRAMSRMRARLEDASSTLAALMERMSGEASPMARLQEAGHEGEGVKGLSDFYSVAQLLMEFQEMVLDAGAVRDAVASSFDAMERSIAVLRADVDEQRWLVDAEREMSGCVVEGFLREINVGSDRTSSLCEGSRPPTLQHDSEAAESNNPEEFQFVKDETMQLQLVKHVTDTTEESDSRQCYHSEDHCIHHEEFERLAEEKIDSDVRSELQCVLYTAAFRDLVRKLAVQACDAHKVNEERDEVDIRSGLQNEICKTIVQDYLKEVATDSVDHLIKTSTKDEVHTVFLAKTLDAWKSTTEMAHSERVTEEEIARIVFGGLTKDLISGPNFRLIKSYDENSPRNNLGRFSMIDNNIEQLQKVKTQINVATEDEGPDSDQNGVPVKQAVMSTDKDDVSDSVKNNVEERLEGQTGEIDIGFRMPPENGNKEMSIPSNKFQAMFMDFEAVTCGKLGTAVLRLRGLDKRLANLAEQVSSLKKSELIYRTAFTRRCCDLQTAEAEVDLLGDEVELLLGLLSKTYKALDHYSPVLHHYLGIREMLSMLGKELALRHQEWAREQKFSTSETLWVILFFQRCRQLDRQTSDTIIPQC
ncbi:unnamed protein product [Urochloa decumbens]|uniref:Uncharacterized protein n=1 Tax=Urochloa decumbens TaxID=240449 RepID=A0ABC9C805_9POAL